MTLFKIEQAREGGRTAIHGAVRRAEEVLGCRVGASKPHQDSARGTVLTDAAQPIERHSRSQQSRGFTQTKTVENTLGAGRTCRTNDPVLVH